MKQQVTIRVEREILTRVRLIAAVEHEGVTGAAYEALIAEALAARDKKEAKK